MMNSPVENLEYNTLRENVVIYEYGRHVQKMINQAVREPDKKKRNDMAQAIIEVMKNLISPSKDVPDFRHKLWDQLFIISNFQLDVDSPFSKISKEILEKRPKPLEYPKNNLKYRYYGRNIIKMIEVASRWEDESTKSILLSYIGNHMKKSYLNWNRDSVNDSVIFTHMKELSNGAININVEDVELISSEKLLKMYKIKNTHSHHPKNRFRKQKKRN